MDHNFSERNHLSGSLDYVDWTSIGLNGGFGYSLAGPFSSYFKSTGPNYMIRVVDNYNFSPNVINTFGIGFSRQPTIQTPQYTSKPSDYGFNDVGSNVFPTVSYGSSSNGIGYPGISTAVSAYYNYNALHIQDTLAWQKGRHSFKFGGTVLAQEMNGSFGGNIQTYNFVTETGGPIDPTLTPWVGSGFANMMLGDVQSANEQTANSSYPRQKSFALFATDDIKVNSKLTLNLGLRWDVTLPGHDATGRWENFDLTAQNPLWAPYKGAWVFSPNASTSFENNYFRQFGPHVGAAYQLTHRLVVRASYGRFYVPLGAFSSGYGPAFPANQTTEAFGVDQVLNNVQGATAFNWDQAGGYPGVNVLPPQNNTATTFGVWNMAMYMAHNFLHLGHTDNWYVGTQYEMARNMVLDVRYMRNTGGNLLDDGRTLNEMYPSYSGAYQTLLASGNIWNTVNSPASAAAAGVPYPYSGFSGPAGAALSPFPQVAAAGSSVTTFGAGGDSMGVSAFNAFIVELKARNTHGLYIDYSYTLSKQTSNTGMDHFANDWGQSAQSLSDWQNFNYVVGYDQRQLLKGYVTYDLPFGRNRQWLHSSSKPLNYAVGGWTVGFYGSYGSGNPVERIGNTWGLPYYFGSDRANFANGATANNMKNHFGGTINLANLQDPTNNDFSPTLFAATPAPTTSNPSVSPFGDTPYMFNNWRWNTGVANESMSFIKSFAFGQDSRIKASLRAEFFNVFNRHYVGGLDTGVGDATFGNLTSAYGNRVGQLGARVEW